MVNLPVCQVGKAGLRVAQISSNGKVSYSECQADDRATCWKESNLPTVLADALHDYVSDKLFMNNQILLVTGDLYADADKRVFTVYTTQGVTYTISTKGCFCTGGWSYGEIPNEVIKLHKVITDGGRQLDDGACCQMVVDNNASVYWVSPEIATQGPDIVDDVNYFVFVDSFTGYPSLCGVNKRNRLNIITSICVDTEMNSPEYSACINFSYKLTSSSGLLVDIVREYQEIDNLVYPLFDDRLDSLLKALQHFNKLCASVFYSCMQMWLQQKERNISLLCGEFCVSDLSCLSEMKNEDFGEAMILFNAEFDSTYPCITQNRELYGFYMEADRLESWSLFGLPQNGAKSIFLKAEDCILKTGSLYTGSYNLCFYFKNIIGVDDKAFVVEHRKSSAFFGAGATSVHYYLEPCTREIVQKLLAVQQSSAQTDLMVHIEDWNSTGKLNDLIEALADFYLSCYYTLGGNNRYVNVDLLNEPVICNGASVESDLGVSYGVLNLVKDANKVTLNVLNLQYRYYSVIARLVLCMIEKCNLSAWYQDKYISFNLKNEHAPSIEIGSYSKRLPFLYAKHNYWCAVEYAEYGRTLISAVEKLETYIIPLCLTIGEQGMGKYYSDVVALKGSLPWLKNVWRSDYNKHMIILQKKLAKDDWDRQDLTGYRIPNNFNYEARERFRDLLSKTMLGLHKVASQLIM